MAGWIGFFSPFTLPDGSSRLAGHWLRGCVRQGHQGEGRAIANRWLRAAARIPRWFFVFLFRLILPFYRLVRFLVGSALKILVTLVPNAAPGDPGPRLVNPSWDLLGTGQGVSADTVRVQQGARRPPVRLRVPAYQGRSDNGLPPARGSRHRRDIHGAHTPPGYRTDPGNGAGRIRGGPHPSPPARPWRIRRRNRDDDRIPYPGRSGCQTGLRRGRRDGVQRIGHG